VGVLHQGCFASDLQIARPNSESKGFAIRTGCRVRAAPCNNNVRLQLPNSVIELKVKNNVEYENKNG
jgi:hypothetical protein